MRRYRYLLTLAVVFVGLGTAIYGQSPYKMLWEVRAPGTARPSYLFGTMHVADERVLDVPDSVMLALAACDGMALELDFDSASYAIFDFFFGAQDGGKSLEDLEDKMRSQSGRSMDDLRRDPASLFKLLQGQQSEPERKRKEEVTEPKDITFLDALLYRVAREQGKLICGLETMEGQITMLLSMENGLGRKGFTLEEIKDIYVAGDLDRMGELLDDGRMFSPEVKETLIDLRNEAMARGIDSLIQLRPTFIGVGAAHLPGQMGILQLLADKGYRIRPVDANTRSGMALAYKQQPYRPRWHTYRNEGMGYSLQLPTRPYRAETEDSPFPLYIGMDFPGGILYIFTAIQLPAALTEEMRTTMVNSMADGFSSEEGGIKSRKPVTQGGMEGEEFLVKTGDGVLRLRILVTEEAVFMLMAGITEEAAYSPTVEEYMGSLQTFEPLTLLNRTWQPLRDEQLGFVATFPEGTERTEPTIEVNDGTTRKVIRYAAEDDMGGPQFTLQVEDLPPHRYYDSARERVAQLLDETEDIPEGVALQEEEWIHQGHKGFKVRIMRDGVEEEQIRILVSANRLYLLMVQGAHTPEIRTKAEEFFDQFELLPQQAPIPTQHFSHPTFEATFPVAPDSLVYASYEIPFVGIDSAIAWEARDPVNTFAYNVTIYNAGPYTRIDSFREILANLVESGEPPMWQKAIRLPGAEAAWDLASRDEADGYTIYRARMIVQGNRIYLLGAHGLPHDSAAVEAFFRSFKPAQATAFDWMGSKLAQIQAGLASADSVTRENSTWAIRYYNLSAEDMETAMAYLRSRAAVRDTSEYLFAFVDALTYAPRAGLPDSIAQLYPAFDYYPLMQAELIQGLFYTDTLGGFEKAVELLKGLSTHSLDELSKTYVSWAMYDAIMESDDPIGRYDQLVFLADSPEWVGDFLFLSEGLGTWGELESRHLGKFRNKFQEIARDWVAHPRKDTGDRELYLIQDYQYLISALSYADPDEESYRLIRSLMDLGDPYVEELAVYTLLNADKPVEKARLRKVLNHPGTRFFLLDWLIEHDQQSRVPAKYFKPDFLAQASLEEYFLIEGDAVPEQLELLERKEVWYEGERQLLYVYRFAFSDDPTWKTAFSGPLPEKGQPSLQDMILTGTNYDAWSPARQAQQVRDWMSQVAEYE